MLVANAVSVAAVCSRWPCIDSGDLCLHTAVGQLQAYRLARLDLVHRAQQLALGIGGQRITTAHRGQWAGQVQ